MAPFSGFFQKKNKGNISFALCQSSALYLPSILDKELYDACDSANVQNVRNLINKRTFIARHRQDYYEVLDFIFNNLEADDYGHLFSLIMGSLQCITYDKGCVSYKEAYGYLLVTAFR